MDTNVTKALARAPEIERREFQETDETGIPLLNPARGIARAMLIGAVVWAFVIAVIWATL